MRSNQPTVKTRRRGRFCSSCGRLRTGTDRPLCARCTDMFALRRGECLYDGGNGKVWFQSTGDRSLVKPEYWRKTVTDQRVPVPVSQGVNAPGVRTFWWILIVGVVIINGCLSLIR